MLKNLNKKDDVRETSKKIGKNSNKNVCKKEAENLISAIKHKCDKSTEEYVQENVNLNQCSNASSVDGGSFYNSSDESESEQNELKVRLRL